MTEGQDGGKAARARARYLTLEEVRYLSGLARRELKRIERSAARFEAVEPGSGLERRMLLCRRVRRKLEEALDGR